MTDSIPDVVIPGDDHYMLLTALITIGLQLLCFFIAYYCQGDKLTDFAGSMNFILITLLTFFLGKQHVVTNTRAAIATAFICISRLELALYLLYRVLRRGKDERFDVIRKGFFSFLGFWIFQMIWAWGVCLPVMYINSDISARDGKLEARDGVGIAFWILGFVIEVVSDLQKDAFRKNPDNKGKWCATGLWKYSRHPNFFGEIMLVWGIWILCTPQFEASSQSYDALVKFGGVPDALKGFVNNWGYATIVASPLLTMLILLLLSGIPSAEGDNQRRFMKTEEQKQAFLAYRKETSPLIPMPTSWYRDISLPIKRFLLFEWKIYETDWSYVGTDPLAGKVGNTKIDSPLIQVK